MTKSKTKRVDVHSHVIPAEMLCALEERPDHFQMRVDAAAKRIVRPDGSALPLFGEFSDPVAKIEGMERKGLDISLISPAPFVFFYWLDADVALQASRIINDGIARMAAAFPDRLLGAGTIPMQNPDAAIAELERIVKEHGFRAIELGCSVESEQLAEPRFRPVLRRAQELGVFIFAHPYSNVEFCGVEQYYLRNLIGNPLHTTIMVAHLMLSGTLDELQDLKICLAHGGGYVPYQFGRLAHGHEVRRETRAKTKTSPRDLLRRFHYDALIHDERPLSYLIDLVGADRVLIGTDAPFDMGEEKPIDRLERVEGLSEQERAQILGRTAMALLGVRS
ncbi:MAG: amidohydrolase family protein [Burkholderiales bacterium]